MKLKLLPIILTFVAAANSVALERAAPPSFAPSPQQVQTVQLAAGILKQSPYRAISLDARTSDQIFERYLKALDPEKLIFLQADIERFSPDGARLADAINRGDLHIPFDVFNVYALRVSERLAYARELLKKGFHFDNSESFEFDRDDAPYPRTEKEMRELWRLRVKNDWLQLKLDGKNAPAIRETLDKRYAKMRSRIDKYKSEDVFQVFMNALASTVDPHTDYFGPAKAAEFEIAMKLSLVGIGAVLHEKDEYTTVRELVPGGPAALSSQLNIGDRIVGIGQGADGRVIDVFGMRLDEVVDLIRGPKDSTVRLHVLPAGAGPDGKHKVITLVRDKISLEQQAARKSVIEVNQAGVSRRVGVISLPAFYHDYDARRKGAQDFKSATRDVIRLLDELKQDRVDGVLVDLRNNGGGSLEEAVALAGLFTGIGPVVQERNAKGQVRVDSSTLPKPVWDGPMGVLINRGSASASEIFAAAIQDYGRGVVIGEPSFGKGTVQTIIDLDRVAQSDKPTFGELKMTIAQFFRINGGTTQLRGVTPDIGFPPISDPKRFGESSYENALPWAEIRPASYTPATGFTDLLPMLKSRHASRVARDEDFQGLVEDTARIIAQRTVRRISLNEAERIKERDLEKARLKSREEASDSGKDAEKSADKRETPAAKNDEHGAGEDSIATAPQQNRKDVWLNEAAHIVADQAELLTAGAKYATGVPLPSTVE